MSHREFHVMAVELIADRQVTRYTCPTCQRCLEDGPEGITLLHKGDQEASHRGGSLVGLQQDVEQDAVVARHPAEPRTLH